MPIPPKPKRLTLQPIIAPTDEVVTARKHMWADWLHECEAIQYAFVEGMLANLSSSKDVLDG